MPSSRSESLKIKAKLLQKAKKKAGNPIPLKDALNTIAKASGFSSWRALKEVLDATEHFHPPRSSAYWNVWYSSYEEACDHLTQSGTFLLPYEKHFFICDEHYIERLGIASDDPDLAKVGRNWVEPQDAEAWERILRKIEKKKLHSL